jgi:hypothetical protein
LRSRPAPQSRDQAVRDFEPEHRHAERAGREQRVLTGCRPGREVRPDQGLTADFTYNTDFAQVEADEAQDNLTRFSLSFPEKRSFFLEGSGVFTFGAVTGTGTGEAPVIFYSRSIGLSGGRTVPVRAGGRLTGRAGDWSPRKELVNARGLPIEGVSIPSGGSSFSTAVASYTAGQHHRVSGTTSVEAWGFYAGTRRTVSLKGPIEVSSRIGIEPNISQNWIDLPEGSSRPRSSAPGPR